MSLKSLPILLASIAFLLSLTLTNSPGLAQHLPFGKKKTSDTDQLQLTPSAGPWLIVCTSFTGDEGLQQAQRLAIELRQEHKMNAYIYTHAFDFQEETSIGQDYEVYKTADGKEAARRRRMKTLTPAQFTETAVLVGDFENIDDKAAQQTLEKIKHLQPKSLSDFDVREAVEGEILAGEKLRAWRGFVNMISTDPEDRKKGPLLAAFLLTNPTLPDEYFAARKVDQFVIDLNKKNEFSLLKNRGNYTVKVATFAGDTTLDVNEIQRIQEKEDYLRRSRKGITQSKLVDAAKKATVLTRELRSKGIKAFEFHDRHESYVCVGEFDWLTREDASGVKTNNPEIEATILKFKGKQANVPGMPNATQVLPELNPKLTAAGITCDAQPLPVMVPKSSDAHTAKRGLGIFR